MTLLININGKQVKNPLARFFITLTAIIIILIVFALVFFLILPLVWFFIISMVLLVLAILFATPKLVQKYNVILIEKKKLGQHK
jgi:ABC-type bacteriocin/lantibiotic exporter with double-glycine peptidase domain